MQLNTKYHTKKGYSIYDQSILDIKMGFETQLE